MSPAPPDFTASITFSPFFIWLPMKSQSERVSLPSPSMSCALNHAASLLSVNSSSVITPSPFLSIFSRVLSQLGHGESDLPGDQPAKKIIPSPRTGVVQVKLGRPRTRQRSAPVFGS